jgi:hypothetical protein
MGRRCFISAPGEAMVAPLVEVLQQRGWEPFVLSDVVQLGSSLTEAVEGAIRSADVVIGLFTDQPVAANTAFELGMAWAMGKPVLIVVRPGSDLPVDLQSFLYVQAELDNVEAVALALDNIGRYRLPTRPERSKLSTAAKALGPYADRLLAEAESLEQAPESAFQELVVRAIEASGAVAVAHAGKRDRGFDIGVWSDDLDAIGANPLLIELKRRVGKHTVRQSLLALHQVPSARAALVISLDDTPPPDGETLRWPVLWISLADLLDRLRTASFAEVVRVLRNQSVHGLPA